MECVVVQDAAKQDGENIGCEVYTDKVKRLLLAQPMNHLQKVTFSVMPRTKISGEKVIHRTEGPALINKRTV